MVMMVFVRSLVRSFVRSFVCSLSLFDEAHSHRRSSRAVSIVGVVGVVVLFVVGAVDVEAWLVSSLVMWC